MKKNVVIGLLVIILAFGFISCDLVNGNGNEVDEFNVTFNLEGGNINGNTSSVEIKVKSGNSISSLPTPQKDDYNFSDWFLEKNGSGNQFTTTTIVTSNLNVFAYWTSYSIPKNITITGLEKYNEKYIYGFICTDLELGFYTPNAISDPENAVKITNGEATLNLWIPEGEIPSDTRWSGSGNFYIVLGIMDVSALSDSSNVLPLYSPESITIQQENTVVIVDEEWENNNYEKSLVGIWTITIPEHFDGEPIILTVYSDFTWDISIGHLLGGLNGGTWDENGMYYDVTVNGIPQIDMMFYMLSGNGNVLYLTPGGEYNLADFFNNEPWTRIE